MTRLTAPVEEVGISVSEPWEDIVAGYTGPGRVLYVLFGSRYGWTNIECRTVETCDSTDGSNIVNLFIKCWPVSIIKHLCNNETDLLCDAERDAALKQKPEHPITSIHQRLINGIIKDLFLGRSDRVDWSKFVGKAGRGLNAIDSHVRLKRIK